MIISVLDNKKAGFFSSLFFSMNHYIFCKKNNISFYLDSSKWLYKANNGWTDYFANDVILKGDDHISHIFHHDDILGDFNMYEYRDVLLNDIFICKDEINKKIEETKQIWNLVKGTYDSIYIRHGDKLCAESKYYPTEKYIDLLLEKNPYCQTIFLQTDDYNCFLDIEKYISDKNFDLKVITLCKPNQFGVVNYEMNIEEQFAPSFYVINEDPDHIQYFESIKTKLQETKPVNKMSPEELYQHTGSMLVGLDIVRHSKYCILDNQSNVSRFINITHDFIENVYDIRFPDKTFDMNRTRIPAWC
jgi:hypothetical protein